MKFLKGFCNLVGFFLILLLAAFADGLMDAYGFKTFCVVSLATLAAAIVLIGVAEN